MTSRVTRKFFRLLSGLPSEVQREARKAYRLFQKNPSHPGLRFKKLEGEVDLWSVRIGIDYRAACVMRKNHVVWFWIGSHSHYDRLT